VLSVCSGREITTLFLSFFTFIHSRLRENRQCQKSKSKKLTEIMEENDFQIDSLAALENLVQEVG